MCIHVYTGMFVIDPHYIYSSSNVDDPYSIDTVLHHTLVLEKLSNIHVSMVILVKFGSSDTKKDIIAINWGITVGKHTMRVAIG